VYDKLFAKLEMIPLSEATMKIPYGAKLKTAEAKRTGIFKEFAIVYPKFQVGEKVVNVGGGKIRGLDGSTAKFFQSLNVDPAIVGITDDKRYFMVVYWDVQHDVERVLDEIEDFKKFKLQ
jgi:hypothetical protein